MGRAGLVSNLTEMQESEHWNMKFLKSSFLITLQLFTISTVKPQCPPFLPPLSPPPSLFPLPAPSKFSQEHSHVILFGITSLQIFPSSSHLLNMEWEEFDSLFDILESRAFQRHDRTVSVLLWAGGKSFIHSSFNQPEKK